MEEKRFLQSFEVWEVVKEMKVLNENHASKVIEDANQARKEGILCDVILLIGPGKYQIKAHRLLLMSAAGFFRAMFTSKFKEASQDKVELPQIDPVTMETIMDFIYIGKTTLTNETIEDIARAANFLEMPKLLEECTKFLTERMDFTMLQFQIFDRY